MPHSGQTFQDSRLHRQSEFAGTSQNNSRLSREGTRRRSSPQTAGRLVAGPCPPAGSRLSTPRGWGSPLPSPLAPSSLPVSRLLCLPFKEHIKSNQLHHPCLILPRGLGRMWHNLPAASSPNGNKLQQWPVMNDLLGTG